MGEGEGSGKKWAECMWVPLRDVEKTAFGDSQIDVQVEVWTGKEVLAEGKAEARPEGTPSRGGVACSCSLHLRRVWRRGVG